jgi:hypothetical protein
MAHGAIEITLFGNETIYSSRKWGGLILIKEVIGKGIDGGFGVFGCQLDFF